jgi:nicotinamide-nucleotide amidase
MSTIHNACAILAIGDELTLGEKLDTNSMWLAERLGAIGAPALEHAAVGDDAARISSAIRRLAQSAPLVICTGGLGPTADDLTRQGLALAMGDSLIQDAKAMAQIEAIFQAQGRAMNDLNRVQAMRPGRAECLRNGVGTAPGLWGAVDRGDGTIADVFCLPGPPREMRPMVEAYVLPRLRLRDGDALRVKLVRVLGWAESDAASELRKCASGDLLARSNDPEVGVTASAGELTFRIRARGTEQAASEKLEWGAQQIRDVFGALCVGEDDESAAAATLRVLRERDECLAVVESCTGGLLGATLTEVPGSSDVFLGGWITYSNAMKQGEVSVPGETLAQHGAVSEETARAMALGGLFQSAADHSIAITGVAGPDGGTDEKPVGTVWIAHAWSTEEGRGVVARRFRFPGDRERVRIRSVRAALAMLNLQVRGEPERVLANEARA